jgi:hypothetical protein
MPSTPRAESLGAILKRTLALYRDHFVLFLSISAVPNLISLMLQFGVMEKFSVDRARHSGMLALLISSLGLSLASLFANSIVTAATTVAISDIYLGRPPDLWDSFARLSGKAFKVFYTAFLMELVVGIGTLLCFIPGIYWAGIYGVAVPAAVAENIGGTRALDRSHQLTAGSVGRIILAYFLTAIFTGIMVAVFNEGARAIGLMSAPYHLTKEMVRLLSSTLGGILFGPISAIALTLEYYDQRSRRENIEIEQIARTISAPDALVSGTYAS